MRDLLAQEVVGEQPNGAEIALLFQSPTDCTDRMVGIRAKETAPKVAVSIAAKLALPEYVNPISGSR